jgi:hypothetical protein
MRARIKAPFATAAKTAKVLGVSKTRFKVLERLASVNAISNGNGSRNAEIPDEHLAVQVRSSKSSRAKSAKPWAKLALRNSKSKAK